MNPLHWESTCLTDSSRVVISYNDQKTLQQTQVLKTASQSSDNTQWGEQAANTPKKCVFQIFFFSVTSTICTQENMNINVWILKI